MGAVRQEIARLIKEAQILGDDSWLRKRQSPLEYPARSGRQSPLEDTRGSYAQREQVRNGTQRISGESRPQSERELRDSREAWQGRLSRPLPTQRPEDAPKSRKWWRHGGVSKTFLLDAAEAIRRAQRERALKAARSANKEWVRSRPGRKPLDENVVADIMMRLYGFDHERLIAQEAFDEEERLGAERLAKQAQTWGYYAPAHNHDAEARLVRSAAEGAASVPSTVAGAALGAWLGAGEADRAHGWRSLTSLPAFKDSVKTVWRGARTGAKVGNREATYANAVLARHLAGMADDVVGGRTTRKLYNRALARENAEQHGYIARMYGDEFARDWSLVNDAVAGGRIDDRAAHALLRLQNHHAMGELNASEETGSRISDACAALLQLGAGMKAFGMIGRGAGAATSALRNSGALGKAAPIVAPVPAAAFRTAVTAPVVEPWVSAAGKLWDKWTGRPGQGTED